MAAAADQRLTLTGLQVKDCDLRILRLTRRDREEHAAAARQHRWKEMIELAPFGDGPGQHLWIAAARRHAQQPGGRIARGEDDRVVVAPTRAARICPREPAERNRRPARDRHLLELRAVEESNPVAVW